jgi:anti-sigma factor RsiW
MSCEFEVLESFVRGELSTAEAARVVAHARGCAGCAAELRWLRVEQGALGARARALVAPPPPFAAVLARSEGAAPAPLRVRARPLWAAGVAAAAAVLVSLGVGVGRSGPRSAGQCVAWSHAGAEIAQAEPSWDEDEAISTEERTYAACLVATPGSGALDVCL